MSQPIPGGRRRVDRVLGEDFLTGLSDLDMGELRHRRADADQEETDLSFLRRMLQGRIDLLVGEIDRRDRGEPAPSLQDRLTAAMGGEERSTRGSGRYLDNEPSRLGEYRRAAERLAGTVAFSDPASLSDEALAAAVQRLRTQEAEVSDLRRKVQTVADVLHEEMGRRMAAELPEQAEETAAP